MGEKTPDFSGWATKNNLRCTDGRTILQGAFAHQDKVQVPLVWQHDHDDPSNVLGHTILEDRAFGVYTHGYFNKSSRAQDAREAVRHGDINSLSIYANKLKQRGGDVLHGNIIEVSLVMKGANPGAYIENVTISHDGHREELDEAIIYSGIEFDSGLYHQDDNSDEGDTVATATDTKDSEKTVKEVFDELTEEQKNVVYYMIGEALEESKGGSDNDDDNSDDEAEHSMSKDEFLAHIDKSIQEGIEEMGRNVWSDQNNTETTENGRLSHSQFAEILGRARSEKADSMKEYLAHAANDVLEHRTDADGNEYGMDDISILFPDAKAIQTTPEFIKRRTEWVNVVLTGTKHSPFPKVKTLHADITEPQARAKGYITGKRKKEEVFKLLKRTTGPTTIYKKQKLDRDDVLDITDFDVVIWLQQEMRIMIEEEVARAILVGDGRSALSEDKIKDPEGAVQGEGIRSILHDDELYVTTVQLAANTAPKDMVKAFLRSRTKYRGTGRPTMFISDEVLTDIMLEEDKFGRPLYDSEQALADKLRVSAIVPVEVFEEYEDLIAEFVNLQDYTVGSAKGGELTNFNDFDLDFNQYRYLIETRLSGALTKAKSAVVVRRAQGIQATPTGPTFADNTITIPTVTGVEYLINDEVVTGEVEIDEDTEVTAAPATGYYFAPNTTRSWSFSYTAG